MASFAVLFIAINLISCGDSNDEPSTSSSTNSGSDNMIVGVWNHEDYTKPEPGHKDQLTITKDGKILQETSVKTPVRDETGQISYQIQNREKECLYEIDEDGETIKFFSLDGTPLHEERIYKFKFRNSNELVFSYISKDSSYPSNSFTYIRAK